MSENKFPEGWDEGRVRRALARYEKQTGEEAVVEDELDVPAETVRADLHKLAPEARETSPSATGSQRP